MRTYREITTVEEWKQTLESTESRPVLLLKHSTRCPVSASALEEFEAYLKDKPREDVDYAIVLVVESRPVSNQIAEDLGVKHESPQIILIDKKKSYWNASHWAVTTKHIRAVLD